jgi:hypothetical protein
LPVTLASLKFADPARVTGCAPRTRAAPCRRRRYGIAEGVAGPETQQLAAKLEKMTGYSIAELAVHADQWSDV